MSDNNDDLALRAPLPTNNSNSSSSSSSISIAQQQQHDAFVRPVISSLLVGAHVLRVSLEVRFTAAVLVHRYYAATGIPTARTATARKLDPNNTYCNDVDAQDQDQQQQQQQQHQQKEECKYVAAACLFLACKREEEPRRLRDVINFVHMIDWDDNRNGHRRNNDEAAAVAADITPTTMTAIQWNSTPPELDASYWKSKERLVQTEQRVLRWLAFDVAVSYPHRAVALLLEEDATLVVEASGDDDGMTRRSQQQQQMLLLLQTVALRLLNGIVYSAAALMQPILPLAVAAVTLAGEQLSASPRPLTTTTTITADEAIKHSPANATVSMNKQWWKSVPVDESGVEAALVILRRLQTPETHI